MRMNTHAVNQKSASKRSGKTYAAQEGNHMCGGMKEREPGARARVFQGGYTQDLHKMLGIESGNQVLLSKNVAFGVCLHCAVLLPMPASSTAVLVLAWGFQDKVGADL